MASIADIRHHMRVVSQTRQITRAMHMISTAKMKKGLARYEANLTYLTEVRQTIKDVLTHVEGRKQGYLRRPKGNRAAHIIIAADKGLAGGYNSGVLQLAEEHMKAYEESNIFCIGQMAREYLERRGYVIDIEFAHVIQDPTLYHARQIAETVLELYNQNMLDEVYIVYTRRISTMVQKPEVIRLLPVRVEDFDDVEASVSSQEEILYEPSVTRLMELLIPQYLIGVIYSALVQSFASEQCARMNAMDAATRNANEMMDRLGHELNRARQSQITNEIAEIIAGADALEG
ncbi:MAG: ATP synthase F1 subunit gamma [Candidatus Spyradocola sp.]|nr:ATP synthase F1 subunit gamma [Candidatus Spyradocola sp.]